MGFSSAGRYSGPTYFAGALVVDVEAMLVDKMDGLCGSDKNTRSMTATRQYISKHILMFDVIRWNNSSF